jgi:organic radical activating enzyme
MKHIISIKDYKTFAGPDWPSYEDVINGIEVENQTINNEVVRFRQMMTETYNQTLQHGQLLADQNKQRQQQVFFSKEFKKHQCNVPWETLGIHTNGDVFICSSPSWIPIFVGNILEEDDIFNVLNSDKALSIRNEILQGRYLYCNHRICKFFAKIDPSEYQQNEIEQPPLPITSREGLTISDIPKNLIFDFDYTCNFQCPSCRVETINNNKNHIIRPINDKISSYIKFNIIDRIKDQPVNIRWCGGEPFISEPYLDILSYIADKNKSNISNVIQTNGSYLKKKSELVTRLLPTVTEFRVSFDAATAETYSKVRVNGIWDSLIENVSWLKKEIDASSTQTKLVADFVIQRANYQEIPQFIDLCNKLGIDSINWQKMWNWGTWPQDEFNYNNVYTSTHPEFNKVIAILEQNKQPYSKI